MAKINYYGRISSAKPSEEGRSAHLRGIPPPPQELTLTLQDENRMMNVYSCD